MWPSELAFKDWIKTGQTLSIYSVEKINCPGMHWTSSHLLIVKYTCYDGNEECQYNYYCISKLRRDFECFECSYLRPLDNFSAKIGSKMILPIYFNTMSDITYTIYGNTYQNSNMIKDRKWWAFSHETEKILWKIF